MNDRSKATWPDEVQAALKRYRRPRDLERHAAAAWPAVSLLAGQGVSMVAAIRRVLDDALGELETQRPGESGLLRDQYIRGRPVDQLATDLGLDPSSYHRRRNRLIEELADHVAARNLDGQRMSRGNRFRVRQPVFGFEPLVAELVAQLHAADAPTVVVIEGMGGLGKTTLARLVAGQCAVGSLFSGVLWTTARQIEFDLWGGRQRRVGNSALSSDDLLLELAGELDIHAPGDMAALRREVIAHCKRSPHLIVFDNLETVEDMAALAPLIDALAGPSRILITTRDRALDALPPILSRRYLTLDELHAATSYQLLRAAAEQTGAVSLATASDDDLARIYDVTGGNPLALWLVAGQAHGMPWQTFVEDLVEGSPRGSSSYELYDYLFRRSWEQISDDARLVLFAMHRCEAGADYELLFHLSGHDRHRFGRAVTELRNRMLLQFDGRYSIHRLTYTFLRVVVAGWWE